MFEVHGELFIEIDNNILLITLIGPFNDMGVKNWTEKVKSKIEEFGENNFFIIMNNTNYIGFTAEASEVSNNFNLWLNEQAMIAKAIVQPSSLARQMNLKNIPSLTKQHIEYFDNKNDALLWIKAFPEYKSDSNKNNG